MVQSIALFALLAAVTLGTTAPSRAAVERPFPIVTVAGEATVSLAPDTAQAGAGVTTEGKTVREASEANASAMDAVLAALKAAGIDERDVQTAQYNIQPIYQQGRQGRDEPRIGGYRVSNTVRFKIREIAKVSEVLDRVTAAGATDLHGISFMVADPSKALDAVRKEAVEDARRKAEIYARAAGAQVGRAVDIIETGSPSPRPMPMATAERAAAAAPPIATGETTLRIMLTATFELLQ